MRRPNFFIIGAPKSGTTAMVAYLRDHPKVFMCALKEPHFFATDLPRYRAVTTERDYLDLFVDAQPVHAAVGEASVLYMYSGTALANLKAFSPDAKLICMLRNPADLVYSFHSTLLRTSDEDTKDFEAAWRATGSRKQGLLIPRDCREPRLLFYDEVGKLGAQVKDVLDLFPRDKVLFVFYEDFAADTGGSYRKALGFLGLEDDGRHDFRVVNANRRHRSKKLDDFIRRPPQWLLASSTLLKRTLGVKELRILAFLRRLNWSYGSRRPLSAGLRSEMLLVYKEDIEKLARLTGRALDSWLPTV